MSIISYSLQHFSGSPVLYEGKICGVTQARDRDKNITYIIHIYELCVELEMDNGINVVDTLFKNLGKVNAIHQMVITSATTNRLKYINAIKIKARECYKDIYHIALPIEDLEGDNILSRLELMEIRS